MGSYHPAAKGTSQLNKAKVAIGIALPQYGGIVSPESILHVAIEAEKKGLASVWVSDRMLLPTNPKDSFNDGPWPEIFATVYDPLEILTYVASRTENLMLGSSVVDALFQNPVTLARRYATLDRLTGGRVIAGIGQGDFRDEFEAANVPIKRRGRGFEEFVLAMRAVWGPDPVSFNGEFYKIPPSRIGPKPVQPGGIPLLLGAFAPKALDRAARISDGIMPGVGRRTTIESLREILDSFRNGVRRAGRDPKETMAILNVGNTLDERKVAEPRALLSGSPQQAATDLPKIEKLDINHIFFDMNFPAEVPIDAQLEQLGMLVKLSQNQVSST